jgi:hypothetical protein
MTEAPPGEVAGEAAIDQRVHRRGLAGEQGIHHVRGNAVPAGAGFDDQRRELVGAARMAAQLGDADRAAITFAGDELLPLQAGRIEPCPPHHRGDDRLVIGACPPHHSRHPAIIAPGRPVPAARRPPAGVRVRPPAKPGSELPDRVKARPRMFRLRGLRVAGVPGRADQAGAARVPLGRPPHSTCC